jgi:adenylate kinase
MSDLLTSPEAEEIKRKAGLVSDFVVVALLFEKLLEPIYQNGVIVDGFPRTPAQVGVIKLLHDQMKLLRKEFAETEHSHKFRRPVFRVTVLYVDEQLSVERQLARGLLVRHHNEEVRRTGWGKLMEERSTDFEPEAARQRYSIFANHYDTLKTLQKLFQFNIIPAGGTISDVEKAIKREFAYQSQYELGEETFDAIQKLPTASEITAHSRQRLIRRLDTYSVKNPVIFAGVIRVLNGSIRNLQRLLICSDSHNYFPHR